MYTWISIQIHVLNLILKLVELVDKDSWRNRRVHNLLLYFKIGFMIIDFAILSEVVIQFRTQPRLSRLYWYYQYDSHLSSDHTQTIASMITAELKSWIIFVPGSTGRIFQRYFEKWPEMATITPNDLLSLNWAIKKY